MANRLRLIKHFGGAKAGALIEVYYDDKARALIEAGIATRELGGNPGPKAMDVPPVHKAILTPRRTKGRGRKKGSKKK